MHLHATLPAMSKPAQPNQKQPQLTAILAKNRITENKPHDQFSYALFEEPDSAKDLFDIFPEPLGHACIRKHWLYWMLKQPVFLTPFQFEPTQFIGRTAERNALVIWAWPCGLQELNGKPNKPASNPCIYGQKWLKSHCQP